MPNIEERERYFEKVINRWENEGGAIIMKTEHPRRGIVDNQNTAEPAIARCSSEEVSLRYSTCD
jgi:hypothetical protein